MSVEIYNIIDDYKKLTQKQIEKMYYKDGVNKKSLKATLEDLKKELEKIKKENQITTKEILINRIFGEKNSINEGVKKQIEEYENKINNLQAQIKNPVNFKRYNRVFPTQETEKKVFFSTLYLAKIYARKYSKKSLISYDDLFQTASEALLSACHYYVPNGEAKFTTYASKCIDNMIKSTYFKKKKKKSNEKFISEKDQIDIIIKYLKELTFIDTKKRFMKSKFLSHRLICNNLNNEIKKFNSKMIDINEQDRVLRKIKFSEDFIDNLLDSYKKILQKSNIDAVIDDDIRYYVSLLASFKTTDVDSKNIYVIYEYLLIYFDKLKKIEEYVLTEKKLMKENDNIIPSSDDILREINKNIRKEKKDKNRPYYKSLDDYIFEYEEKYSVNPLETLRSGDVISKEEEKKLILEEYEEFNDNISLILNNYEKLFDFLDETESRIDIFYKEFCFLDNNSFQYIDFIKKDANGKYNKYEAYEILKKSMNKVKKYQITEKEYLKFILKIRNEEVLSTLNRKNTPLIEENIKTYEKESILKKTLTESNIKEIENDIEILYLEDEEFIESLFEKSVKKRKIQNNLEDDCLCNLFLEDYYNALNNLTELQRNILLYWFDEEGYHNYSAKEISQMLNISTSKVYSEKRKALNLLKNDQTMQNYNVN